MGFAKRFGILFRILPGIFPDRGRDFVSLAAGRAMVVSADRTRRPGESSSRLMARKLKVFETSLGFFDLAIAAPSMKAALQAWGADSNLFHQGAAKESKDRAVIAAAMSKPGLVLKRPVGSDGAFTE